MVFSEVQNRLSRLYDVLLIAFLWQLYLLSRLPVDGL